MVCGEVFKTPIERKGAVPPQGARFSDYKPQTISMNGVIMGNPQKGLRKEEYR